MNDEWIAEMVCGEMGSKQDFFFGGMRPSALHPQGEVNISSEEALSASNLLDWGREGWIGSSQCSSLMIATTTDMERSKHLVLFSSLLLYA